MKKGFARIGFVFAILLVTSCEDIEKILPEELSDQEISQGLREALEISTDTAVADLNQVNGYFADSSVKIPFPPEAAMVLEDTNFINTLEFFGLENILNEFVEQMNRSAEEAASRATPIFTNAIRNITFEDARAILDGDDTAATNFLRVNTSTELINEFKPDIEDFMESNGADQSWNQIAKIYNGIPGVTPIPTDISQYVTEQAVDGLFLKIREQEEDIRQNPQERVTRLLERVFSGQR